MSQDCAICGGVEWVCENHPDKPWTDKSPRGCECGTGMPCSRCNPLEALREARTCTIKRGSAEKFGSPLRLRCDAVHHAIDDPGGELTGDREMFC